MKKLTNKLKFLATLYYIKGMSLIMGIYKLMIIIWGFIRVFPDTIASLIMWAILKSIGDHERADKGLRHLLNGYCQYITQVKSILKKQRK